MSIKDKQQTISDISELAGYVSRNQDILDGNTHTFNFGENLEYVAHIKVSKVGEQTISEKVEVQTYYTNEDGRVYLHQKIGDGEWTKTQTYYKEIPFTEFKVKQQTICPKCKGREHGCFYCEGKGVIFPTQQTISESWEKRIRFSDTDEGGAWVYIDEDCINLSDDKTELVEFIKKEKQNSKKEVIEELDKWNYDNGITHKESFIKLRDKLQSLLKQ